MPKQIQLPEYPKVEFGVFNQWGYDPGSQPNYYRDVERFQIGYRAKGSRIIKRDKTGFQESLVNQWRRICRRYQLNALSMEEALVGREFVRTVPGFLGSLVFAQANGAAVTLSAARRVSASAYDLPTAPFTVRRILKSCRTFHLEGGGRIDVPSKLSLHAVDDAILDEIYGPLIEKID